MIIWGNQIPPLSPLRRLGDEFIPLATDTFIVFEDPCPGCGKEAQWFGRSFGYYDSGGNTRYTITHLGTCI